MSYDAKPQLTRWSMSVGSHPESGGWLECSLDPIGDWVKYEDVASELRVLKDGARALVHVRFDLARREDHRGDTTAFVRADMPCVPALGEVVNLKGNPYRVIERGWAIEDDRCYAFVRVR